MIQIVLITNDSNKYEVQCLLLLLRIGSAFFGRETISQGRCLLIQRNFCAVYDLYILGKSRSYKKEGL